MDRIRDRYLKKNAAADLASKMVFIAGPRQVGKTTFALSFLGEAGGQSPAYLNWDDVRIRPSLMRGELPPNEPLIVLDEIHKFARWRSLVKGFYDTRRSDQAFIITGSARLDFYSRGGDSLQGRYHGYRLHPFSLPELGGSSAGDLDHLLRFGGFPEPCLKADETLWCRWERERVHRVIFEDIRDLERVRELTLLEMLAEELPRRVGSPLSVKGLSLDLGVSHETADRWISVFERMYLCFRVAPFGGPRVRAVKKEKKLYLWDWSSVVDPGHRFENLVACQLLKYCHFLEDTQGFRMELRFLRDVDKREVDFIVLRDERPEFAVECKTGERAVNPALFYFRDRTSIPRFFQVHTGKRDYVNSGVRVLPFPVFCREEGMP